MLNDRIAYANGEFVGFQEVKIHLMSHSLGRGSAIFEVLSLHDTSDGPAVFRLDAHIDRFFKSAELLNMEFPISRQELDQAVLETVKQNRIRKGAIKIIGFYPQIAFNILPPQKELDISIFVFDPEEDIGFNETEIKQGTTLGLSGWRKLDPQTVPIEAKAAANYLNGMVAYADVRRRGFENVIMLDTQGFIAEGGTEAIFLVKDGRLLTPSLGTVLDSISRKSILEAGRAIEIETVEERLHPNLLYESEEIFMSCTPFKILPVRKFEDKTMGDVPGPVSRKIVSLMDTIVTGQDERFRHWLFPVAS